MKGFPLEVFLLVVMFRVLLLSFLVWERCRGVIVLIVLSCLAWLVVPESVGVGKFLGALKKFGCTGKPQHTLQDMAVRGVFSLVQRFRHNGVKVPRLLLDLGREFGDVRAHVPRFCMNRNRN